MMRSVLQDQLYMCVARASDMSSVHDVARVTNNLDWLIEDVWT